MYGITSSASSGEERYKQMVANKLVKNQEKDVEVSLAEFTDTIQGQSVVRVLPVTGSDEGTSLEFSPHIKICILNIVYLYKTYSSIYN